MAGAIQIPGFIKIFATFRNLQVVKLKMRSLLSETGVNSSTTDVDFEAAKDLRSLLCLNKSGLSMTSIVLWIAGYNERPNRDSDELKWQRSQGHNPERYFEFSWLPDGTETIISLARQY